MTSTMHGVLAADVLRALRLGQGQWLTSAEVAMAAGCKSPSQAHTTLQALCGLDMVECGVRPGSGGPGSRMVNAWTITPLGLAWPDGDGAA